MGLVKNLGIGTAAVAAVGVGCVAYGSLVEIDWFRLTRETVPVLPAGAKPIRVLHLSDLHMLPEHAEKQAWLAGLAGLEPDLVVNTGDNLSHPLAGAYVTRSLGRLLDVPGVYVWGSNDYYAPKPKNPFTYFRRNRGVPAPKATELPWRDLGAEFTRHGWEDLTHREVSMRIGDLDVRFRGTDDAHLGRDRYDEVAGPVDESADLTIGVTHAPYLRLLDGMTSDGHDLIMAGHTHGGQVCVPLYGALVTNCDIDPARVKGLSEHSHDGRTAALHVSGGMGTSPYAPFRFACRPEATLLTLVPR
ncbi:metallophosphoesterase [Propionibacteriaceae bacterium Y1685]|uniref:metallophosphoesterase n=1 Tax=Microlunatus sp. Y1700 TaxID=3418487 RepID=UPI003B80F4E8